jgi:hypothetical protein
LFYNYSVLHKNPSTSQNFSHPEKKGNTTVEFLLNMETEMKKKKESYFDEYLLFSFHVILFHILVSGLYMRRNIPATNTKLLSPTTQNAHDVLRHAYVFMSNTFLR